jgi:hypothetical protein
VNTFSGAPNGMAGIRPRDPIDVHVSMAMKGANGAPSSGGRFWLTSQSTHSHQFTAGQKSYSSLARDLHPGFVAWNQVAQALGRDAPRAGAGKVGTLRGNLVHSRLQDLARWSRAMQKYPKGDGDSPASKRPACEGNGVRAIRFYGMEEDKEIYREIACPNRECQYAMRGLCHADAHLIFRLRWDKSDSWQAGFNESIAEWNTGGWESLANLAGLFELILGTEAVLTLGGIALPPDFPADQLRPGLAKELGVLNPSLVGMPFVMTIGWKTKAADASSPQGKRYPVVSFSPDGDMAAWLIAQRRNRAELSQGSAPLALIPASVQDADFEETVRHESRIELTGSPLAQLDLLT